MLEAKLNDKELNILEPLIKLKEMNEKVGEDEFHLIIELFNEPSVLDLGLEYEEIDWKEINNDFNPIYKKSAYSEELHDIIEKFIERGYVERNPKNPIEICYSGSTSIN